MLLTIWSKHTTGRVFQALSPILKHAQDLQVRVVSDFSIPEGTTAVLALGKESLEFLTEQGLYPKKRTATAVRGTLRHYNGTPVLFSYDPGVGDIDHGWYVDLLCDAGIAVRLVRTGSIKPKYGNYEYVNDFQKAKEAIEKKFAETGKPVDVTLDLETVGKDPWRLPTASMPMDVHGGTGHPGAYIVTAQVSYEIGMAHVVYFKGRKDEENRLRDGHVGQHLKWLLTSPMVRLKGANLKYDLVWLWVRAAINCTNFTMDTSLVGSLLDENRTNSLDVHTKIYAPELGGYSDEFDAVVNKERMDQVPLDMMLPYAGGDTDATLRISRPMIAELAAKPQMACFYVNILHPAARAFEMIERGGVLVDMKAYKELEFELLKEYDECLMLAKKVLGGRIVAKHWDSSKRGGLNLQKASLVIDFMFSPMGLNLKPIMFTEKSKEPSTSLDHVQMFSNVPEAAPFVEVYQRFGSCKKMLSTYVGDEEGGFLSHLRSDGRFHPTYFLFVGDKLKEDEGGAVTGRLSCKDPAFQTIPKHSKWAKLIRRCFIAPPGYVVVERDYSQGELRVVACIANCLKMIEVYKQGLDLHTRTAAGVSGMTYQQLVDLEKTDPALYEATRQKGKAGNFGLVFGMQVLGFMEYARKNYKVIMSEAEATNFRNGFFSEYHELLTYHDEYKDFARKNGFVATPLGRERHLPLINSVLRDLRSKAERQAINSPVQGTLTDMLIWSLAIEHQMGYTVPMPSFGAIHDAAYNYCPEDKVDIYVPQHLQVMENLPFELVQWKPQLKFIADAKVGPSMGDLKKYKAPKPEALAA